MESEEALVYFKIYGLSIIVLMIEGLNKPETCDTKTCSAQIGALKQLAESTSSFILNE